MPGSCLNTMQPESSGPGWRPMLQPTNPEKNHLASNSQLQTLAGYHCPGMLLCSRAWCGSPLVGRSVVRSKCLDHVKTPCNQNRLDRDGDPCCSFTNPEKNLLASNSQLQNPSRVS